MLVGLVNSSSQAEAEQFIKALSILQQKLLTVLCKDFLKFDLKMHEEYQWNLKRNQKDFDC